MLKDVAVAPIERSMSPEWDGVQLRGRWLLSPGPKDRYPLRPGPRTHYPHLFIDTDSLGVRTDQVAPAFQLLLASLSLSLSRWTFSAALDARSCLYLSHPL